MRRHCRIATLTDPGAALRGFLLNPSRVDFGTQQEGTYATITVAMKNLGVDPSRYTIRNKQGIQAGRCRFWCSSIFQRNNILYAFIFSICYYQVHREAASSIHRPQSHLPPWTCRFPPENQLSVQQLKSPVQLFQHILMM